VCERTEDDGERLSSAGNLAFSLSLQVKHARRRRRSSARCLQSVRAAGGALQGRRQGSPRQRRRDSLTVNCQHNRGKALSSRTLRRTPLSVWPSAFRHFQRIALGRRLALQPFQRRPGLPALAWLPLRIPPGRCTWTRKAVRTRTSRSG